MAGITDTSTLRDDATVLARTGGRALPLRERVRAGLPGPARRAAAPRPDERLRRLLAVLDITGFALAWLFAAEAPINTLGATVDGRRLLAAVGIGVTAGVAALVAQRLYLARVCSVRAVELSRTARAAGFSAAAVLGVAHLAGRPAPLGRILVGAVLAFLLVGVFRGVYGALLRERRARGLHSRPIVLVGTNTEALELAELVDTHPEFGYRTVGVIGRLDEYQKWPSEIPYLGPTEDAAAFAEAAGANGVLIATSSLDASELRNITRELLRTDLHVHISSGLWGIDARRLRSVPLAHEPLFYVERVSLTRWNKTAKRAMDLAVSSILLLIASPVLLLAALAIKLTDRGPVLFKQVRIGRGGRPFTVFKMRTMVPDAESMLPEIAAMRGNQRDGVLFKLDDDPRYTKVGRILEAASLDELPQLFNVLNGTMSLVGPRPALPSEVAQFDEELLERFSVPPGITGLWQVEARDNPSFSAYRRLDLFYVENWSVTLDLALMVETVSTVIGRLARGRR